MERARIRMGHTNPYSSKNILSLSWEFIFAFAPNICELPLLHSQSCKQWVFFLVLIYFWLCFLWGRDIHNLKGLLKAWSSPTIRKHLPSRGERWYYSPRTSPLKMQQRLRGGELVCNCRDPRGISRSNCKEVLMKVRRWSSRDLGFGHSPQFGGHHTVFPMAKIVIFPGFYVPR